MAYCLIFKEGDGGVPSNLAFDQRGNLTYFFLIASTILFSLKGHSHTRYQIKK